MRINHEQTAKDYLTFRITNAYDPKTQEFTKTVSLWGYTYSMTMAESSHHPGTAIQVGPSFTDQLAEDFPSIPEDELQKLDDAFQEAQDGMSLSNAKNLFFYILASHDLERCLQK
ncbi:MAG: hypothetical protein ACI4OH_05240 [Mitsuokella sp.]|uniref:hypothetical protein n=1 Tax=Mitsuokella sp. TaxID=2049034 RepID=UPI003F123ECA